MNNIFDLTITEYGKFETAIKILEIISSNEACTIYKNGDEVRILTPKN